MKWSIAGIMICLLNTMALAQHPRLDSLKSDLAHKPKFVLGLHNRYSLVAGDPVKVNGLYAGLDFNHGFRVNFGLNWMPEQHLQRSIIMVSQRRDTVTESNQMAYVSLTGEYTLIQNEKWKFTLPVLLGVGQHDQVINHSLSDNAVKTSTFILPVEAGITAMYYVREWVGIKAGLGNRLTFGKSFSSTSGPYYNLGISVFAGVIYNNVKEKIKKSNANSWVEH